MESDAALGDYALDANIGFLLRRCYQESVAQFGLKAPAELSAPRFSALARLVELGPLTQNRLGRLIAADGATIKGIVDRLRLIGAVDVSPDPSDKRQRVITITAHGRALCADGVDASRASAEHLLGGLSNAEQAILLELLAKVADGTPSSNL